MQFPPLEVQIDNTIYEVPFDRFFEKIQDDYLTLRNITLGNKVTLGMSFLNTFYQAYDMQRNQLALIPNLTNRGLNPPIVLVRNAFFVIMPCATMLFICLLAFAAFYPVVGHARVSNNSVKKRKSQSPSSLSLLSSQDNDDDNPAET